MSNSPEGMGGYHQTTLGLHNCGGECLSRAAETLGSARLLAKQLGCALKDTNKRFDYLLDVATKSEHERAEIMLEHALAIYEVAFGQEHPNVAHMLTMLAELQAAHGKQEYGQYLQSWSTDILSTARKEPTHEFFNLFGYSDQPEDQSAQ